MINHNYVGSGMISNFIGGALKWAAMDEPKLLVQGGGHQTAQR